MNEGRARRPKKPGDTGAPIAAWLTDPLPPDVAAAVARLARAPGVRRIAIMPDVHLAASVCVGCVVGTSGVIYPQAVGSDIGCGMACVAFDAPADALADPGRAKALLGALRAEIPILRHRGRAAAPPLPAALVPGDLSAPPIRSAASRDGVIELGTLGRGNHFLEFQRDDQGRLWAMVHSGSRAVGQAIAHHHLALATKAGGGLCYIEADSDRGRAYIADAAWAERYAAASRAAMLDAAERCLRRLTNARRLEGSSIDCSHNHVRPPSEENLWVHRKGASSAAAGEPGLIPGSMAAPSYHVTGRGNPESLRSSSHGAGRAMSRTDARSRLSGRGLLRAVRDAGGTLFDASLADKLVEEAPEAYKDIRRVMRAQRDLVTITRTLTPVLAFKGV